MELKRKKKVCSNSFRQVILPLFLCVCVEGTGRADTVVEEEEETKKEEDDWKPYIPEIPNAALFAVYTSPDTFWLSMVCSFIGSCQYTLRRYFIQDDYDAGYLYHCQLSTKDDRFQYNPDRQDTVVETLPVPNSDLAHGDDIPFTSILIR